MPAKYNALFISVCALLWIKPLSHVIKDQMSLPAFYRLSFLSNFFFSKDNFLTMVIAFFPLTSETTSDQSDIESRIHALKDELRKRKSVVYQLKKEQKKRQKERLKAQEASLLKQLEVSYHHLSYSPISVCCLS